MKLAIVSDTFPPDVNGVAMTLERLAAGMIRRGHRVEVIHPGAAPDSCGRSASEFDEVTTGGFNLLKYGFARAGWPCPFQLQRRWKKSRPDVLYVATEGLLGASAMWAARRMGIPVVTGYHTHFGCYLKDYHLEWLSPLLRGWLRFLHNAGHATLVPTAETQRQLEGLGYRNLRIMERGVDTELFHPARRSARLRERWGAGPTDPVLLSVGRIAPEKNCGLLFEAWEAAKARFPTAKLVLAGDGPLRRTLSEKYPDAIWCGFLSGIDLAETYASADLMLFPSRTETFGNVLLEAMASGLTTISYHRAASLRFIDPGNNGYAASGESDEAWLRQVLRALRERPHWPRMAAAARHAVENQSWDQVTRIFEHFLAMAAGLESSSPRAASPALQPIPVSL